MREIKHVVILDDTPYKVRDIESAIRQIYPSAETHVFGTVNEGLRYMTVTALEDIRENTKEWLLLTDMQMPVMDRAGIDRKAGRHVLNEMHRHMLLHEGIRMATIVISGDEQDADWLKQLFDGCLGCVHYSPFVSLQSQLQPLLENME